MKYLIMLGLVWCSVVHGGTREILRETNEARGSESGIRFELLQDYPEMIPVVAKWQYDDWHGYDTSLTVEKVIDGFEHEEIIVAIEDGVPIGSISLKEEGEPEFSEFFGRGPWIGSFHVISEKRNKGIGKELAMVALTIAKGLGYNKVIFFTSNFANVAMYVKGELK